MAECLIIASSFEQGLIIFRHIINFLEPTFERYKGRFRINNSMSRANVRDRETGAIVQVLGSDPRRLHGHAPKLIIADELAQWPPGQIDRILAALETSRGKIPGSRMLWIGTRPASPGHPFAAALGGGVGYSQVHAARPDDPPFQRRSWARANPSLDAMPDLEAALRREARRAKIEPSALAQFRALRLNQGVPDTVESVVLEPETWSRIEGDADRRGPYVLGVDLGGAAAMSAASAYWPESGRLESYAVFPELPTLDERGRRDGVARLYSDMAGRGELGVAGHRVSDVPGLLGECLTRWGGPELVVCDDWRQAELRQHLEAIGFPLASLETRRMGWKDGGEDVRDFRRAALDGQLRPLPSLLLRSALAEARTISDPAGNSKLARKSEGGRRQGARDDAIAAAILAVGAGVRAVREHGPEAGRRVSYAVV